MVRGTNVAVELLPRPVHAGLALGPHNLLVDKDSHSRLAAGHSKLSLPSMLIIHELSAPRHSVVIVAGLNRECLGRVVVELPMEAHPVMLPAEVSRHPIIPVGLRGILDGPVSIAVVVPIV